jgi:flagellar protein FliS
MNQVQQEQLRARYLADQVMTATPAQRLLMLFDQLLRDIDSADRGFDLRDLKVVSDNLIHAQHILFALRDPLDVATPLGEALSNVYGFCLSRLLKANMEKDRSLLPAVREIVDKIATANRIAAADMMDTLAEVG